MSDTVFPARTTTTVATAPADGRTATPRPSAARRRPRTGLHQALVAATLLLVGLLGVAAPSSAAVLGGTTTVTDGGIRCVPSTRGMLIKPPAIRYSGAGWAGSGFASVQWQPVIYRYQPATGWQPWTNTTLWQTRNADSQWFSAAANNYGISNEGWTNSYTGRVLAPDFQVTGFPAGHYAVKSYLWKSSDGQTVSWWASGGGYCSF